MRTDAAVLHTDVTQLEFDLKSAGLAYGWMQTFLHVRILEFMWGLWHLIRKYHVFFLITNQTH
jgi:hypothetical protein